MIAGRRRCRPVRRSGSCSVEPSGTRAAHLEIEVVLAMRFHLAPAIRRMSPHQGNDMTTWSPAANLVTPLPTAARRRRPRGRIPRATACCNSRRGRAGRSGTSRCDDLDQQLVRARIGQSSCSMLKAPNLSRATAAVICMTVTSLALVDARSIVTTYLANGCSSSPSLYSGG